jgi:hypothetical protein
VQIPRAFVRDYMAYARGSQTKVPTVGAAVTLPIVLADGTILTGSNGRGIDRHRGILFDIPHEVIAALPECLEYSPEGVARAVDFLTEEWLCDVLTDYQGKCVLIAAALTLIERTAFPARPTFWITAARRGSGKTTAFNMLVMAALGHLAAGAAWSHNEEERRKSLFGYLMNGAPYIIWDNIKRGSQISCEFIEKICTMPEYVDRVLGQTQNVRVPTITVQMFTGNAIAPRGDLASRSLRCELRTERPDPENRDYDHPDPIAWTQRHRAKILGALYTVLLGNPTLKEPVDRQMPGRFQLWQRIVGSAVEHAAQCAVENENPEARTVSFADMFSAQDEGDEEGSEFAQALEVIRIWICGGQEVTFTAGDIEAFLNRDWTLDPDRGRATGELRDILFGSKVTGRITARQIGRRLSSHLDEPIRSNGEILTLIRTPGPKHHSAQFWIRRARH